MRLACSILEKETPFAFCVSLSFCVNMHHKVWAGAETCLHL